MTLKGIRTKISGYLASALPVAGVLGYDIDPELVTEILTNHGVPLVCAQLLASIGVHHYRNQAKIDVVDDIVIVDEGSDLAPEAAVKLDPAEQQVIALSNGEFEDV